jgi:hypothetical protein
VEINGVVLEAQRLLGRPWAVVSLSLVFELPDGRRTAPAYISGSAVVDEFLKRFGAASPDDLVGTAMTIEVSTGDAHPAVSHVASRTQDLPQVFRRAFEGET